MSESTFTPLKEEPENANVKEEPDDPYISFDEVPLHMEGKQKDDYLRGFASV